MGHIRILCSLNQSVRRLSERMNEKRNWWNVSKRMDYVSVCARCSYDIASTVNSLSTQKKKWKWKRRKSRNGIYFPLNPAHSIWCGVFTIAKEIRRHSPWQATFCGVSFTVKVKSIILFIILLLNFLFFGWCFDMTCLSSFDCTDYFVYWHRKWFNGTEKRFSAGQLIRCDVCHKVTHFVRWKNIGIIMKKAVAASLWLTQFIIY